MMWVHWESQSGNALLEEFCHLEELDSYFRCDALKSFSCLKYTSYYDDSLYNYRQIDEVHKELAVLATLDLPTTARNELNNLNAFIERISGDARKGCVLKFYGE